MFSGICYSYSKHAIIKATSFFSVNALCGLFIRAFGFTVKPPNSGHSKQQTCHGQRTKHLVPNVTIFLKLPSNSGHLSITDKFLKTRRRPLFRDFTILHQKRFQQEFHKIPFRTIVMLNDIPQLLKKFYLANHTSVSVLYTFDKDVINVMNSLEKVFSIFCK